MNITPIIMSCQQRKHSRERTLKQLEAAGLNRIIELIMACEPPSIENNRWGAHRAATQAYKAGGALLFLEDDIDANPNTLTASLKLAYEADTLTSLCIMRDTLYPEGFEDEQHQKAKLAGHYQLTLVQLNPNTVSLERGFHGSQAILVPHRIVRTILARADEFILTPSGNPKPPGSIKHGFDFWLKDNAANLGGIWSVYPNPIQHRGERSTFGGKDMSRFISKSYHLTPQKT